MSNKIKHSALTKCEVIVFTHRSDFPNYHAHICIKVPKWAALGAGLGWLAPCVVYIKKKKISLFSPLPRPLHPTTCPVAIIAMLAIIVLVVLARYPYRRSACMISGKPGPFGPGNDLHHTDTHFWPGVRRCKHGASCRICC